MRFFRTIRTCRSAPLILLLFAFVLVPSSSWAQLAPTGGHYAARASDTGFAGAVSSQAGYFVSVPLDLPAARGGLPVPVGIVYGGHTAGAAGLAWDVPLAFIRRDTTIAHRRPVGNPDTPPVARGADPSGLDCGPEQIGCTPPPPAYGCGSGGGGSAGCPACNDNHHQPPKPRPIYGPVVPVPTNRWAPLKPFGPTGGEGVRDLVARQQWDGFDPGPARTGQGGQDDSPGTGSSRSSKISELVQLSRRWSLIGAVMAGAAITGEPAAVIIGSSTIVEGVVTRDIVGPDELTLGPGQESNWLVRSNSVGGTVFESTTPVHAHPSHVEGFVTAAQQQGQPVTI